MSRADRIAEARRQAQVAAKVEAERAAEERRRLEEAQVLREIHDLVPQVLAALEEKDWPDSELIHTKAPLGRHHKRAGWWIAARKVSDRDSFETVPCYLLSNGKFNYGGDRNAEQAAEEIVQISNVAIRDGLLGLLARYR